MTEDQTLSLLSVEYGSKKTKSAHTALLHTACVTEKTPLYCSKESIKTNLTASTEFTSLLKRHRMVAQS